MGSRGGGKIQVTVYSHNGMARSATRDTRWATEVVAADGPVYLVDFSLTDLDAFLGAVGADPPSGVDCRLLVDETVGDRLRSDFLVESRVAEAVANGSLSVRTAPDGLDDHVVVAPERTWVLVAVDEETTTMAAEDAELVGALRRKYADRWSDATPLDHRSPPLGRFERTVERELSEEAAGDLRAAVRGADRLRWGERPDPTDLLLLVAARHGTEFHAATAVAESTGLASRSSCSRAKQRLEKAGLVETERIPQGVGRPRQRLVSGAAWLTDTPGEELVHTAREQLR